MKFPSQSSLHRKAHYLDLAQEKAEANPSAINPQKRGMADEHERPLSPRMSNRYFEAKFGETAAPAHAHRLKACATGAIRRALVAGAAATATAAASAGESGG